jgi:hypothetical protein
MERVLTINKCILFANTFIKRVFLNLPMLLEKRAKFFKGKYCFAKLKLQAQ